jgi:hypothetical protein
VPFFCDPGPCPETDQECKEKRTEEIRAQVELLRGWTFIDHVIGPVMCPFVKGRHQYLAGQMQFWNYRTPKQLGAELAIPPELVTTSA